MVRRLVLPVTLVVALAAAALVVTGLVVRVGPDGTAPPFVPSAAEGLIPDGEPAALDSPLPAIQRLDPDLRAALAAARDAAAADGLPMEIVSGWRSAAYQQHLFDEAVRLYADEDIARQYVATPEVSSHVTGDAVDVGPLDLQFWLIEHGSEFGLCQTYANERWHWELATEPGGACPAMLSDASAPRV